MGFHRSRKNYFSIQSVNILGRCIFSHWLSNNDEVKLVFGVLLESVFWNILCLVDTCVCSVIYAVLIGTNEANLNLYIVFLDTQICSLDTLTPMEYTGLFVTFCDTISAIVSRTLPHWVYHYAS